MNYFELSTEILINYITNPLLKQFQNNNEPHVNPTIYGLKMD
jgi:hypothetical protein